MNARRTVEVGRIATEVYREVSVFENLPSHFPSIENYSSFFSPLALSFATVRYLSFALFNKR